MNADQLLDTAAKALLAQHAAKMATLQPEQCTSNVDRYVLAAGARLLLREIQALDDKASRGIAFMIYQSKPSLEALAAEGKFDGIASQSQHVVHALACEAARDFAA